MIRDYQAIQKTWFLRGKQRIIKTTGKHRGVKLLATVDYGTGQLVWQEDVQYNAETFLDFLNVQQFMDEVMKVPMTIIDRLCIRF
jgi:hypothetical protein